MELTNRPGRNSAPRPQKSGPKNGVKKFSSSGGKGSGKPKRKFTGPKSGGKSGGRRNGGGGNRGGGRKQLTFDPSQFINTNPIEAQEEVYVAKHTFKDFGFANKLSDTVESLGITVPSPIQDQVIPHIMDGSDVIGLAETGTGKTAAFLLPLIEKMSHDWGRQVLILTPTRELAIQIDDELKKLGKAYKIFSTVCVGGVNIRPQIRGLRKKNQFIIGTPGRVMDLLDRGDFKPENVTTVVLDEADRMLDMGFIGDMKKIMSLTPQDRETLFFSATMAPAIEKLVGEFLTDPVTISVKKKDVTNSIKQDVITHTADDKYETLLSLLNDKKQYSRVIIFGAMKHSVEKLSKQLNASEIRSESIHGNKSHPQRQRALQNFKNGRAQVLCATDVAARGIHVDDVTHVINYDLPTSFDEYVHRIGRTGRGTKRGMALTFILSKKKKTS